MTDTDSLQAICAELRHPNACIGCAELADRIERLDAEMRKERENLRAFAREALEDFWEGDGTMQDLGEKHHLLIPTIVSEPCGEGCSCAEYGASFPTDCYRFAPALAAQSSAKGVDVA